MCGICGAVSRSPGFDFSFVHGMQEAMLHRGPDGGGDFEADRTALAVRRLSIIDLTGGWQPLYSEDRSWCSSATVDLQLWNSDQTD
jgi:asparagine synthase (glutamine-hydrolysing)